MQIDQIFPVQIIPIVPLQIVQIVPVADRSGADRSDHPGAYHSDRPGTDHSDLCCGTGLLDPFRSENLVLWIHTGSDRLACYGVIHFQGSGIHIPNAELEY